MRHDGTAPGALDATTLQGPDMDQSDKSWAAETALSVIRKTPQPFDQRFEDAA